MSVKHAVLALLAERRGYGYDLAQRFEERVGPGWQLNPSAIYPALDQLERDGHVTAATQRGGTHRSPRVVYAATPSGMRLLDAWLRTTVAAPDPVRCDLHLKLAFAGAEHGAALASELLAREQASAALLARLAPPSEALDRSRLLIDDRVAGRLRADVDWLARARAALASSNA